MEKFGSFSGSMDYLLTINNYDPCAPEDMDISESEETKCAGRQRLDSNRQTVVPVHVPVPVSVYVPCELR